MATPVQSTLGVILEYAKQKLMADTRFPSERVYVIASPEHLGHFQADQWLSIRPGSFIRSVPISDGSSRIMTHLSRVMKVHCYTRLALDHSGEDYHWLLHEQLGHLALEDAVANSLDDWLPMTPSGHVLTLYNVKLLGGSEPTKEDRAKAPGWGQSVLEFAIHYMPVRSPLI